LIEKIKTIYKASHNKEEKMDLFQRLAHVEGFEKYLHNNFVGAKQFSIQVTSGPLFVSPMVCDIV
ncbi:hypothetical protein CYI99_006675, partial [Staphylococcus pseudintermedius]